jgi:O-antigen/teichoic acid export membrane protein
MASAYRAGAGLLAALLAVRLLGAKSYGNVAIVISIFAFCLSLASAVFMVLVPKVMALASERDMPERRALYAAANLWAVASIAFVFFFAALVGYFADHLTNFGGLDNQVWDLVRSAWLVFALLTSFQIYSSLNSAMIESAGRLDLAVQSQMLGPTIVLSGLVFLSVLADQSDVASYLVVLCLGAGADMLMVWNVRRALVAERLSLVRWRDAIRGVPDLLKSGSAIQFSAFMNVFLEPLNKLLLGHFAGGSGVAAYDLAMKVIWGLQGLFGAGMRVFLHLVSQGAQMVAVTYIRFISLLAVPVVGGHVFGGLLLLTFAHYGAPINQQELMIFFGVATISNLCMIYVSPLYVSLIAQDDRDFLFVNQVRLTLANVVASVSLIPVFGLIGAAFGLCFAALYNTRAIYVRFQKQIGPLNDLWKMIRSIMWRFSMAAALFVVVLVLGAQEVLNVVLLISVSLAVLVLLLREPLVGEVRKRFFAITG